MTPFLAFLAFTLFVLALLWTTRNTAGVSAASWLAVIWTAVGASRSISTWFYGGPKDEVAAEAYDAGNPVERNFYLLLIVAGLVILYQRRASLRAFFGHNAAFALFVAFWGLSTIWSDYSIITLKRWIKDSGTIVIVLTVLTEADPPAALRVLFVRCAYILIPYSVLLIRYFSDLGRVYSQWSGELMYVGVTSHKNTLGMAALASILFLTLDLSLMAKARSLWKLVRSGGPQILILVTSAYLLYLSHSATSLVCAGLGLGVFFLLKVPYFHRNFRRTRILAISLIALIGVGNIFFDLKAEFLNLVGRDPTLTTRTEVWPVLLKVQTSPILGPGFKAFWAGTRLAHLWNYYGIIQAHNGYLETYLNGGFAALILLGFFLLAGLRRINSALPNCDDFTFMRMAIWAVAVIHNWTEASFNSSSPLWFALIAVATEYPQRLYARRAIVQLPARRLGPTPNENATRSA